MQSAAVRWRQRWQLPSGIAIAIVVVIAAGCLRNLKTLNGLAAIGLTVAFASGAGLAMAGGGAGTYTLEWAHPGEVLEYRSCGCADSCWVARVKTVKTQQTLAQLRCDCEKAYAIVGSKGREQPFADNCQAFAGDNKQAAIRHTLKDLLWR